MSEKKVLIIGAGGIGSYLANLIYDLIMVNQINLDYSFYVVDFDIVEEKNLLYQNFDVEDIGKPKCEVIGDRFSFNNMNKKIETFKDLEGFDCIITCVDNFKTRKLLFEFGDANPSVCWIDLRSEGRVVESWCKHENNTLETMLSTLGVDEGDEGGSCQLKFQLDNGKIEQGNKVIAVIGSQYVLNFVNNVKSDANFRGTF